MLSAQNLGSLRATSCILSLTEAEAEAGVEDGAEDGSFTSVVHQNLFVYSREYERK